MEIPKKYLNLNVMVMLKGEEVSILGIITEIEKEYITVKKADMIKSSVPGVFIPVSSILAIKPISV